MAYIKTEAGITNIDGGAGGKLIYVMTYSNDSPGLQLRGASSVNDKVSIEFVGDGRGVCSKIQNVVKGESSGSANAGDLEFFTANKGTLSKQMTIDKNGYVILHNLPTNPPPVPGAIWNDNGTLKVS